MPQLVSPIVAPQPDSSPGPLPVPTPIDPMSAPVGHGQPKAHGFFWTVLAVSAMVSITGNATHAVLYAPTKPAIAAAIAIVPPIALLAAVHSVAVLARAHTTARLTHILATALTILIALAAFRLSFTALRALAISAAVPTSESWLFPIIVEGTMTQATISLLAFAHSGLRRHPAPPSLDSPARSADTENEPPHRNPDSAHDTDGHPSTVHTPDTSEADRHSWAQIAEMICNGDPARRRDSTLVTNVLIRHFTDGRTPTQIAHEINLSRSAISRIIGHATELLPREPRAHLHNKQTVPRDQSDGATAGGDTSTGIGSPASLPACRHAGS
ncbi:DUF2637 domain-containing protein [Nocardia niigatensis]